MSGVTASALVLYMSMSMSMPCTCHAQPWPGLAKFEIRSMHSRLRLTRVAAGRSGPSLSLTADCTWGQPSVGTGSGWNHGSSSLPQFLNSITLIYRGGGFAPHRRTVGPSDSERRMVLNHVLGNARNARALLVRDLVLGVSIGTIAARMWW